MATKEKPAVVSTNDFIAVMDLLHTVHENDSIDLGKKKGNKHYTMVADRVLAVRKILTDSVGIETEIIKWGQEQGDLIVVKAIITKDGRTIGSGHAEEIRGEGYINETSSVENAETSAIGRALASCGFHGGEYASSNEIARAHAKKDILDENAAKGGANAPDSRKARDGAGEAKDPKPIKAKAREEDAPSDGDKAVSIEAVKQLADMAREGLNGMEWKQVAAVFAKCIDLTQTSGNLVDIYKGNKKLIDDLDKNCPEGYQQVTQAFSDRKEYFKSKKD